MKKVDNSQFYLDLGTGEAKQPQKPAQPELPGQTTFDLFNTAHIVSLLGDGTQVTLHTPDQHEESETETMEYNYWTDRAIDGDYHNGSKAEARLIAQENSGNGRKVCKCGGEAHYSQAIGAHRCTDCYNPVF